MIIATFYIFLGNTMLNYTTWTLEPIQLYLHHYHQIYKME